MAERGVYPVPESAREVLVFGGTFDPPHRAHVELPLAARDRVGASWLLYIPAGRSPLKDSGPEASDADRMDMLDAALEGRHAASISTIECDEVRRGGRTDERPPSYTVETLERLHEMAEGVRFRLLIGADQAATFHRWREPERIIELAEPLVMLRAPMDDRLTLLRAMRGHWRGDEADRWGARIVDVPVIDASATRVRELLGRGELEHPEVRAALPEGVLRIIRARRLYLE